MAIRSAITSTELIGRQPELNAAVETVEAALDGSGSVLCISGEAGIGKSRLLDEALLALRDNGRVPPTRVLRESCLEFDRSVPYALTREVVSALRPDGPSSTDGVSAALALLDDATSGARSGESGEARRRIWERAAAVATNAAGSEGLVLALEDLHWSDDASLAWLLYLAHKDTPGLALLITCRTGQQHAALEHVLAELGRTRRLVELELAPLEAREARQLIATVGEELGPRATDAVAAVAEGNPFYIEELVGVARDASPGSTDGDVELPLPRSLLDTVRTRFTDLDHEVQRVMVTASVVGRSFDVATLCELLDCDEAGLTSALREAVDAGFVVEERAGTFAFRHALTREAIQSQLLATERRALHVHIATTLELAAKHGGLGEPERLAERAYHHFHAEQWEAALACYVRLAERANALFEPRIALVHYTQALDAERHLGSTRDPGLRLERGKAHEILGEIREALDDFEAALTVAGESGDLTATWRALLQLGAAWTSQDYDSAGHYFDEALCVAEQLDDPLAVGDSLNGRANWALNAGDPVVAREQHARALQRFRALGDVPRSASTLDLLGMAGVLGGDLDIAIASYREAITLARELGDRALLASSLASLSLCDLSFQTWTMGRPSLEPGAGIAAAAESLAVCRTIDWRVGEAYALIFLSFARGARGEYVSALAEAHEGLRVAEEIDHRQWRTAAHCALSAIHLDLMDPEAALGEAGRALELARETRSAHWIGCATAYRILALVGSGHRGAGSDVADAPSAPATLADRLLVLAAAEAALLDGRPDEAYALSMQLCPAEADRWRATPRVGLVAGRALHRLRRLGEAEIALRAAIEGAEAAGAAPLEWRLAAALSEVLRDRRRRAEAEEWLAKARMGVSMLADQFDNGAEAHTFVRRATSAMPEPGETPLRAEQRRFGGLTLREREVAALVATGRSNREIAELLVLGERTVESHVGSALRKLGFKSRAQLAAWVVDVGLVLPTASEPSA